MARVNANGTPGWRGAVLAVLMALPALFASMSLVEHGVSPGIHDGNEDGLPEFTTVDQPASSAAFLWSVTWSTPGEDESWDIWGDGESIYTCGYSYNTTLKVYQMVVVKWNASTGMVTWSEKWLYNSAGYAIWGANGQLFTCGGYNGKMAIVAWDAMTGDVIWSSISGESYVYLPAGFDVWTDGNLLLACCQLESLERSVFAFDTFTGSSLWNITCIALNLWSDGDYMYVSGYDEYYHALWAYNLTNGERAWATNITWGNGEPNFHGANGILYVSTFVHYEPSIVAINATNGQQLWEWQGTDPLYIAATGVFASGTHIYACIEMVPVDDPDHKNIIIVTLDTNGRQVWASRAFTGYYDYPTGIWAQGGHVYAAGRRCFSLAPDDMLLVAWDAWDPLSIDFIGSPGNQTAWLGTAGNHVNWTVDIAANDRSPFNWSVLVNGTTVASGTGAGSHGTGHGLDVAWPADGQWLGDYNFTYILVDARGQREQDTTILHVANQAPVATIAPATHQPGDCPAGTCTFDVTFSDPGFDHAAGVRCTLLVGGKAMQAVATNASNGSIRFRVGLFFGRQEVSVRADDGLGGVATASIFVTFTPENVIIFQIAVAAIVTASIILVAIAAFVTRWKARAALTSRP